MNLLNKFIYFNIHQTAKVALEQILTGKIDKNKLDNLPGIVWRELDIRSTTLKKEGTFGANVMLRLSLLTLIIYEQLLEASLNKQEAIKLTSAINWMVYEKLTNRFWVLTRPFSRKPITRVKIAMGFFINYFPYKSPGYEMEILDTEKSIVAFDVKKCPAANFFKKHNLNDLCIEAWCNLDFLLAEKWNVRLKRDKTLANENNCCNFKFIEKRKI